MISEENRPPYENKPQSLKMLQGNITMISQGFSAHPNKGNVSEAVSRTGKE